MSDVDGSWPPTTGGALPDAVGFDCPRCGQGCRERLWGPCTSCRAELATTVGAPSGPNVVAERFEPRLHVVPNHVATRE